MRLQQHVAGYKLGVMQYLLNPSPEALHLKYSKEGSYQVINVADDFGLNIPEQINILTYDDNKWLDYLKYPVSVITQATVEIGYQAVERILRLTGDAVSPRK